jgi:hypothetical protein
MTKGTVSPQLLIRAGLLLLGLLMAAPASAGQSADFDHYRVHYNAVPSVSLTPEVARQYNITRSRSIAIVTIAVIAKSGENQPPEPVESSVQGTVSNDVEQATALHFQEVTEGKAHYYIAPFQFREGKLLTFRIKALPLGTRTSLPIRFTQRLFND